ncbi:MAG: lipocalin family protein [Hyphomicrobiales bacterium]
MISFAVPRKTAMKVATLLCVSLLTTGILGVPAHADARIVKGFNIERYLGTWHEIARLPVFYQNGCKNSTAIYKRIEGGQFSVTNTCEKGARLIKIQGVATQPEPGYFKVEFKKFLTFRADYIVHWVDPNYRTAVVGTPNGKRVWILSRTKRLSPVHRAEALKQLKKFGYANEKLIWNQ